MSDEGSSLVLVSLLGAKALFDSIRLPRSCIASRCKAELQAAFINLAFIFSISRDIFKFQAAHLLTDWQLKATTVMLHFGVS